MLGWLDSIRRWVASRAAPHKSVAVDAGRLSTAHPEPASTEPQADSPAEALAEAGAGPNSGAAAQSSQPSQSPHSAEAAAGPSSPFTADASVSPSEMPSVELMPVAPSFRTHPLRTILAFISQSLPVFIASLVVVFGLLYFGFGAFLTSTIDDNPAFRPAAEDLPPGGSVAVAMTSAVLNREIDTHSWTPDDPWFFPSALLDNMPAWQRGIRMAVYRFAGSLAVRQPNDPDLAQANEALAYPPDRWWIGADWPWIRTASGSRYDDAVDSIRAYNARIANGSAPLVRDAPTLAMMLEHLASALAEGEEALGRHVAGEEAVEGEKLGNDEIFYAVRGEAYASMLILAGLREDFAPLIRQRQLSARWASMARTLEAAVDINPLIVTAGDPGSVLVKNHLMEQGFAVQRAREQLLALAADLRKAPPASAGAAAARP